MYQQVAPIEIYVKNKTNKQNKKQQQQQQNNNIAVNKRPYIHLCLYPY